jgi:hypothetical protein
MSLEEIPESKAHDYIARMFWGLTASAVDAPERSFQALAGNHATAGGENGSGDGFGAVVRATAGNTENEK